MRYGVTRIVVAASLAGLAGCSVGGPATGSSEPAPVAGQAVGESGSVAGGTQTSDGITVIGQGLVTGQPDVVRAMLGVEVVAGSVEEALGTANERASAVIDALQDAGVASEDIQTQDLSLRQRRPDRPPEPEPGAGEPGPPEVEAVNVVEVRLRDTDRIGEVLQAAADAGGEATTIRGVRFALEDDAELLTAARERAFEDARQKAEHLAELAGRELGALVSVREHPSGRSPTPERLEEVAADQAVPVEPGSEQLTVVLTAVWSLD